MAINSIEALGQAGFGGKSAPGLSDNLAAAAEQFIQTLRSGEEQGIQALAGEGDPHQLVTALAQSKLAIEATVAVRDRAVEAYQELLRMPV